MYPGLMYKDSAVVRPHSQPWAPAGEDEVPTGAVTVEVAVSVAGDADAGEDPRPGGLRDSDRRQ